MLGKYVVPAKLSVALVILALLSACIEQPELADRRGWAQRTPAALSGVASPAQVAGCAATPDFSFSVPDPSDDSFGGLGSVKHEIINVSGAGDTTTFCLTVDFAGAVFPPHAGTADGGTADAGIGQELVGFVEFDTDADATTGRNEVDFFCPERTGMGGEALLDMFSVSEGTGSIVDRATLSTTPVPVTFDGNSFTAVIPLSAIGGDSSFNLAMVLGTFAEPTDCAPNGASLHSPDGTLVLPPPPPPPPANDAFATATSIASLPFTDSLSTVGATTEPGEPSPPCAPDGRSTVWYSFTPAADVTIAADTVGSNFNTVLAAFTGSDFATLQLVGCQAFGNRLVLDLTAGTTYYFQVGGLFGETGNLVFNVEAVVRPANDDFANATSIASLPFTDSLSTGAASTELDEPAPSCAPSGGSVWYSFTPAVDTYVEANTAGSNYDTTLSVYTGARGALTQIACNDDFYGLQSRVLVQLSAGTTYYFQLGGFFGQTGNLVFNVAVVAFVVPANDNFANATRIASLPFTDSLSIVGATTEPGEPPPPCAPVGGTVWYSFTPAADVSIAADTLGSNFNTVLAAFTGSDFATLQPVGCQAFGNRLTLDLRAGTTYYFQVGGFPSETGNLVFNVAAVVRPANDNFANATSIASLPFMVSLSTQGATTEPGEPPSTCAPVGSTVWYSFTPAADVRLAADTLGSNFNTVLSAFTGSDFATLQPVGCQAFGNRLVLELSAGTTYYFQIGGLLGETGNLVFNVAGMVRPRNDNFANATSIASLPFTDSLSTQGATLEPGEPLPSCAPGGSTVWYSFTPAADMSIAADTLGSNFNTVLAAFTGSDLFTLQPVGCQAFGNRLVLDLRAGTTYHFQVGGLVGETGNLVFNVAALVRPGNDNFANATSIASLPFTDSLSTQGATTEPGEPSPSCAPGGSTVWYSFTPAADMSIAADTVGSNFSTVLSAFTGSDFATLQFVGCQAFGNRLVLDLRAGTTYHFQVGGFFGETGNLVFNLAVFVRLAVGLSIDPSGSVLPATGAATVTGVVTCNKRAFVDLRGSLRQRAGRGFITGSFALGLQCDGATRWSATVVSDSGPFAGGSADVFVSAAAFSGEGESASAEASATIRLQGTTPAPGACPRTGNDGFEAGAVDSNLIPCWTVSDRTSFSGSWCNQKGTTAPQGPCSGSLITVATPPEALQAAMTNQSGPGAHVLYRCGVLRSGRVSFALYINNEAGVFSSPPTLDHTAFPNQQFRVDLVAASAISTDPFTVASTAILLNLYQTQPGDPPVSGYLAVSADASSLVGRDVCIRYAQVENIFHFHAGVDGVEIDLRTARTN